jgi:transcriptional regulator with GAF, ATPase, and Fis domain
LRYSLNGSENIIKEVSRGMEDGTVGHTEIEQEKMRRVKAEETLASMQLFLYDYFHRLGPDPMQNIDIIVETSCKALHSAVALYNRLEDGVLKTWSIYNGPSDFKREDNPSGHICYDMTIRKRSATNVSPIVFENLEGTKWEELDSNVKTYGIKSYIGFPVILENKVVGSLCVVDLKKRNYSQIEKDILAAFSKAVVLEEERKLAQDRLTLSNKELLQKNQEIKQAFSKVKTLSGLLPICAACKKIRDDEGYWNQIEAYLSKHTDTKFSHGLCEECAEKLYGDQEWYKYPCQPG